MLPGLGRLCVLRVQSLTRHAVASDVDVWRRGRTSEGRSLRLRGMVQRRLEGLRPVISPHKLMVASGLRALRAGLCPSRALSGNVVRSAAVLCMVG